VPAVAAAPLRLSAADVGRRVVVRHRLPDGRATDVLGELLALDGAALAVRREDGAVVRVPLPDVVAARPVPPRAPRRPRPGAAPSPPDVLALEAVMAAGWPAVEVVPLGAWLLRASSGFTSRANSALPLGDPGVPLERAVDAVEAFSEARGLVPRVAVPALLGGPLTGPVDGAALDALLAARGWAVQTPTAVMTAPLAALGAAPLLPPGLHLDLAEDPDEDWLALYRYRGQPAPAVARALLAGSSPRAFAAVRTSGGAGPRTVAVARGTVTTGARTWAGVTAVEVAPAWRRRGLARALLAALAGWAAAEGATDLYLQVALDNTAARSLYASAGLTDHHRYSYRAAPPAR
jgi:N-acetylglutamate synthase